MKKILLTGALGQIGTELTEALIQKYGSDNIIVSDVVKTVDNDFLYEKLDVTKGDDFFKIVKKHNIGQVYHLAAVLSAVGEKKPDLLWKVNMEGLKNALDIAKENNLKLFVPSSIAAFGPTTPLDNTPQVTIQRPTTVYGVSKVAGELLCDYYVNKYGVDSRGIRFPGIISNKKLPGGGTTDYAVHIYYDAVKKGTYTCYIAKGTYLDMVYMPDAIKGTLDLMAADGDKLKNRNAYNITAMSIDPECITKSIQKIMPDFYIKYNVDLARQAIAESWPNCLDDRAAKQEWQWQPDYDLDKMTIDMLKALKNKA